MNAIAFGAGLSVVHPVTERRCPPDAAQAGIRFDTAIEESAFETTLLSGLAQAGHDAREWTGDSTDHIFTDIESVASEPDPDALQARGAQRSASENFTVPIFPLWLTALDRPITIAPWTSATFTDGATGVPSPQEALPESAFIGSPERVSLPRGIEVPQSDQEAAAPDWVPVEGLPAYEKGAAVSSPLPAAAPLHHPPQHPSATVGAEGPHSAPTANRAEPPLDCSMPEVMAGLMRPMPTAPTVKTVPTVSAERLDRGEARMMAGEAAPALSGTLSVARAFESAAGDGSMQVDPETTECGQALRDSAQSTTTAHGEPNSGHAHQQDENGRREHSPSEHRPPIQPSGSSGIEASASTAPLPPTTSAGHRDHVQAAPAASAVTVPSPFGEADAPRPPLHTVQVKLGDTPGEAVNVRFVESRGVVTVSVRTQDESLANALNAGTPTLERRLQSQGWSSEFHPVEGSMAESRSSDAPSASGAASTRQQEAGSMPMVRSAQAGPGTGSGDPNRRPGSSWVEQNEELMNTAALRRLGQKGALS